MTVKEFEAWLTDLLSKDRLEVGALLRDPRALHFFITWSLFESKCFGGFLKLEALDPFASRLVAEHYDSRALLEPLTHFHDRYQDAKRYRQLTHRQVCERAQKLLGLPVATLTPEDVIFFVSFVVYRFRNNMFHGNKGVRSWLNYGPQIALCTAAMQSFVSHAEGQTPSLSDPASVARREQPTA